MKYSKYNIFSKIRDSENFFIINLLTGNADILDTEDAEKLKAIIRGEVISNDPFTENWLKKVYL